jgi:K+-transporting ATPase ATPase C chain
MFNQLLPAFRFTLVVTVLTGLLYPGLVTAIAKVAFPTQASGSLIERNGKVTGSALIGQNFTKPIYFHPRPSAAGNDGYDASASTGSNLGPTSQKLSDRVKKDAEKFRADNPGFSGPIPADSITTSASGLDPDISPATALAQVDRVAQARMAAPNQIRDLVNQSIQGRTLGFLGEPRVNVLLLNLALDEKFPVKQ